MALQLAKAAGLRVVCVIDVVKNGQRLSELGADVLVDRLDTKRAVEIIRGVTGNKLRFGFDTAGKDSATLLQEALNTSDSGKQAHLVGLTGLPKNRKSGITYHSVPIKIFHDVPEVGESIVTWLEDLLLANSLQLPQIEIAQGGLAGINEALDRLRSGTINGKRIVVPVSDSKGAYSPAFTPSNGGPLPPATAIDEEDPAMGYHDQLNSDPDRIKFAYCKCRSNLRCF